MNDGAVPVQADRREVGELTRLGAGPDAVEVLDADQELAAGGAGEQPREQGGAQVADMQVAGRAGGEAARGCAVTGRRHAADSAPPRELHER